jgi:hypothetical protein
MPPYPYYVGRVSTQYRVRYGVNEGQIYEYIDVFAYACLHEAQHAANFECWWPFGYEKPEPGQRHPQDYDGDNLPDWLELSLFLEGYNFMENPSFAPPNNSITPWDDNQAYTLENEPFLEANTFKGHDWAFPGSNWPLPQPQP